LVQSRTKLLPDGQCPGLRWWRMPQRIMLKLRPMSVLRTAGAG